MMPAGSINSFFLLDREEGTEKKNTENNWAGHFTQKIKVKPCIKLF